MLAPLIDDEHLTLAIKLDEHLRKKLENSGEDFKKVLESFERTPSSNSAAEFAIYVLLTEAMLDDKQNP